MFDFVRAHQRWLQFILLVLILPAFVLTGVASLSMGSGSKDVLAVVGDRQITQAEFSGRYGQMVQQARSEMGAQFDEVEFAKPEHQAAFLTQMVNELVFRELLDSKRMVVGDAQVQRTLAQMKGIPQTAQGTIDVAAYQGILAGQGLTAAQHQQNIRLDLLQADLAPAVANVRLPMFQTYLSKTYAQARVIERQAVDMTPYTSKITPSEEQIKNYYDGHLAEFSIPESFDVEYMVLPAASQSVVVSDEDIRAVFGKEARAEDVAKVRADPTQLNVVRAKVLLKKQVAELDAKVAQNPQDLAAVAKAYNLPVQITTQLGRNVDAKTPELFRLAQVREGVLTSALGNSKVMAPVIALDSGALLLARVREYRAAGVRSFDSVKADVAQKVRVMLAMPEALEQTQKSLAARSVSDALGAPMTVSWLSAGQISQEILAKAMTQVLPNGGPSLGVVSDSSGLYILRVVKELALPEEQTTMLKSWAERTIGTQDEQLAFAAYMNALRQRLGVQMYPERIKSPRS